MKDLLLLDQDDEKRLLLLDRDSKEPLLLDGTV